MGKTNRYISKRPKSNEESFKDVSKYGQTDIVCLESTSVPIEKHHGISLRSLVINLIADLCPHGMLPLAYGFSRGSTGLIPAFILLYLFGAMSASTMILYARLAHDTKSSSISEIWAKLVNKQTQWIADVSIFLLCFGCCVFYSAFIGDIFTALYSAIGITGWISKRFVILGLLSSLILLPLCELDDLSALSFSSVLGVGGIVYTALFHVIRLLDKSYSKPNGFFYLKLPSNVRPTWNIPKYNIWKVNYGTLVLANMLCVAYLAHYNAINYYKELIHTSISRYSSAIHFGFGISMIIFGTVMLIGYSLFGTVLQPLVLNNFHHTDDLLATLARFATGLAITFAYPLMFAGLKSSMANAISLLLNRKEELRSGEAKRFQNDLNKFVLIPVVQSIITGIAMKCTEEDVSIVLGIVGSILGCSVAYIMPGFLQLKYINSLGYGGMTQILPYIPRLIYSCVLIIIGVISSVMGVWMTADSISHHDSHRG